MIAVSKKIGMVVLVAQCFFLLNGMTSGDEQQVNSSSQLVSNNLKPRRLGIYCDNHESEGVFGKSGVVANSLAETLHQNASAILVSESVFNSCVTRLMDNDDFFEKVVFVLSDWEIYHVNESSYFLLLPLKNKARKEMPYEDYEYNEVLGEYAIFNEQALSRFTQNSLDELRDFILENSYSVTTLTLVLSRVFNKVQQLVKPLVVLSDPENNVDNADSAEKKDHALASMRPWNIYLLGHGLTNKAIAGLAPDDFAEVVSFFNTAINVNFLLISSCFVAGNNQLFMTHTKNLLQEREVRDLRYKLAIAGSSQGATIALYSLNLDRPDRSNNYDAFFATLEKQDRDCIKEALSYLTVEGDWFRYFYGVNSIPQVLLPRVGWTQVFTAVPGLDILTETKLKKYSIEKENNYDIQDVLAVVIKPQEVKTVLRVKPCSVINQPVWLADQWGQLLEVNYSRRRLLPPGLDSGLFLKLVLQPLCFYPILMTPAEGPFLKVLDEVILSSVIPDYYPENVLQKNGILRFLRDSFLNVQGRTQPICWVIKKLTGFNDLSDVIFMGRKPDNGPLWNQLKLQEGPEVVLHDVVVCAYSENFNPTENSSTFPSTIVATLMFRYNGKFYCMHDVAINPKIRSEPTDSAWVFRQVDEYAFNQKIQEIDQKITTNPVDSNNGVVKKERPLMLMDLFNTKNSESLLDNRAEKNESSSEVVLTKKTDLASVLTKKAEQQRQKVYSNEFKEGAADSTELPVKDSSKKMLEQKPFAAESDESGNDYSGGKGSDARYLLRRQQVSRDRCFAIINEWASGVEISDESIREYFDAVSILSQNQAKFLLPFAEKRLSLEQKKLFMEKAKEVKKTVLNETKSFYRKEDSSCPWIASDIFTKMDEAFFSSINRAFFQEKEIARKQLLKKAARELLK